MTFFPKQFPVADTAFVVAQAKVDPTAKKPKAPAQAQAGAAVTNLGPKFG